MKISEARLNDLAYMALKRYYFEPCMGSSPRECDIRICMDLAAPERITSLRQAILSPNEVAGKGHELVYEVDPGVVFDTAIDYLVDHWRAEVTDEAREEMREDWAAVVQAVMAVPEDQCGG